MHKTIGVVGLGIMGGAFAKNLVAAGWRVIGCDLEPARCEEARAAGIEIVDDAAAVAEAAERHHHQPADAGGRAGDGAGHRCGAKRRAAPSSRPARWRWPTRARCSASCAEAGHTALDCPISGTGAQAKVKDIVVYASGDAAAIKRLEPAFLGFARKVHDLGAFGNGSKMKFVANHLVAIHNVAAAEAMVLGMKAGLDPHRIVEVVGSGAGTSRVFELRAPMMAESTYLPATMRSTTWTKDLDRDRRLRLQPRLPDAAVRPVGIAACGRARDRPRRRRHRRRVRGLRGDGRARSRQARLAGRGTLTESAARYERRLPAGVKTAAAGCRESDEALRRYLALSASRKPIASSSTRTASMTGTTGRASNTKAGSIEQNL